jgi:hypothetical protein
MTCRRRGGLGGDGDGEGQRGLWEAAVGGVTARWVGSDRAFEREQLQRAKRGNEGKGWCLAAGGGGGFL